MPCQQQMVLIQSWKMCPDCLKILSVGSRAPISDVSAWAADIGRSGLDFIYSMPGSVGGAVWMNARCYGPEISEVLVFLGAFPVFRTLTIISAMARAVSWRGLQFPTTLPRRNTVAWSQRARISSSL